MARANVDKTRKQARFMDRKMRILQGAIAGQAAADAAQELQVAGVLPAPAAGVDPLDVPVNVEQAAEVMNAAALQADQPNVLLRGIADLRERVRRIDRRSLRDLTVRDVVTTFIMVAMTHAAMFPLHAAPRERSFLDIAAGHFSTVSTATGFIGLPVAGPLGSAAYGLKAVGKTIRNYNARTGRFPNTPANALRREVNLAEFHPSIGTGYTLVKLAGAAPGVAFNAATGARGVDLAKKALGRVMRTAADTAKDLGELVGVPEEVAVGRMKAAGTTVGAVLM